RLARGGRGVVVERRRHRTDRRLAGRIRRFRGRPRHTRGKLAPRPFPIGARSMNRVKALVGRFRAIQLAPVFALLALFAWAFASPIGAGPDDDYHLVSVWCANGGSEQCLPGSQENTRTVAIGFEEMVCYAQRGEQ